MFEKGDFVVNANNGICEISELAFSLGVQKSEVNQIIENSIE